jgi:hypothetical protein
MKNAVVLSILGRMHSLELFYFVGFTLVLSFMFAVVQHRTVALFKTSPVLVQSMNSLVQSVNSFDASGGRKEARGADEPSLWGFANPILTP